jgi:hypothetical protein
VGLESWKLAGLTFMWRLEGVFLGTCHLESSEIDDRDYEQARHTFNCDARVVVATQSSLRDSSKPTRRTGNTIQYWRFSFYSCW